MTTDSLAPLANTDAALAAAWHPVALATEVTEEPHRVVLLGDAWALARVDGTVVAVEDVCPHRRAPLSAGRIVDGCFECPYHGWRFDPSGRCVAIPATGSDALIPSRTTRRVPAGVVERYGVVWLAPDPPIAPLVELPEWADPGFPLVQGGATTWRAGAGQMVDNFLDVGHFPFTHLGTFGVAGDEVVHDYDTTRAGWVLRVDHRHLAQSADPTVSEPEPRSQRFELWAPFTVVLRLEYHTAGDRLAVLLAIQPVDDGTSRLYRWNIRNTAAAGRRAHEELARLDDLVVDEDRSLLERFRAKALPLDLRAEVHTRADRATVELRRLLADLVADASPEDRVKLGQIHHVAICVTDLDAAVAFYTDVLGLVVIDRPDTLPNPGAWLALGDQQVHLLAGDDEPPTTFQHFSIAVDDLVGAAGELREHGVVLEGHQVVDGYGLQAFLFDPARNRIELYQQTWPVPAAVLEGFLADAARDERGNRA